MTSIIHISLYTLLPPKPPTYPEPRTFIILPKPKVKPKPSKTTIESADAARTPDAANYFLAATNTIAPDEISAHTGMFDPKTNDGYYELGLVSESLSYCQEDNAAHVGLLIWINRVWWRLSVAPWGRYRCRRLVRRKSLARHTR